MTANLYSSSNDLTQYDTVKMSGYVSYAFP
jgi:hypothetical protein